MSAVPLAGPTLNQAVGIAAAAAVAIGLVEAAKEAPSRTEPTRPLPKKKSSSESWPPQVQQEAIKESKPTSFSPSLGESYDNPFKDVAMDIPGPRVMPEVSGLYSQAARVPPVGFSYDREGGWRISVPFPLSIPVGAGYLLYQTLKSSGSSSNDAPPSSSTTTESATAPAAVSHATTESAATAMPPSGDDGQDSDGDDNKFLKRKDLEDIYEALKKKAAAEFGPGSSRTIWKNRDYRVDVGHLKNGVRHWEFQVNSNPSSRAAKELLKKSGKKGTDAKHFKGEFDTNNPPGFDKDWKRTLLDTLDRL